MCSVVKFGGIQWMFRSVLHGLTTFYPSLTHAHPSLLIISCLYRGFRWECPHHWSILTLCFPSSIGYMAEAWWTTSINFVPCRMLAPPTSSNIIHTFYIFLHYYWVSPRKPKWLMNGVCRTHFKTCLYDPLWSFMILCDPSWSFMHDLYGMILKSHFKTPFVTFRPSLARHFRQESCLAAWQWGARGAREAMRSHHGGFKCLGMCGQSNTTLMVDFLTKTVHWQDDDDDDELEGIEVVGMRWNGLPMEHSRS